MISKGNHKAKALAGTFGGEAGKEQVEVKFEVVDGPDAGQTISWFGFFYGNDAEKAKNNSRRATESLIHAGWDGEFTEDLVFTPSEVTIVVEHEQRQKNGKVVTDDQGNPEMRAVVRWVNALGGGLVMKDRLDKPGLIRFKQRMGGLVIEARKKIGGGATPNGAGRSRGASIPDEQSPFAGDDDGPPF